MKKIKSENEKNLTEIAETNLLERVYGGNSEVTLCFMGEKPDKPTPVKRKPKRSGLPLVDK
ncbi:hypothetical protein AB6T38_11550 [Aliiglaciecola sp. SL4]|uniref:hypothetical protein n=1 Tax=Aliiglaciecola sp. SL4 TaxID=3239806 RepID=UPI00355AEA67